MPQGVRVSEVTLSSCPLYGRPTNFVRNASMTTNRRSFLKTSLTSAAALSTGAAWLPSLARADGHIAADKYVIGGADISIHPVAHASFVMQTPNAVIYVDPVGGAEKYASLPKAQLIMLTHEHGDHFDIETLQALLGEETTLITNPSVFEKLPAEMQELATAIGNGDNTSYGELSVDAIPAYNLNADRLKYHPKGRDNGYVLTIGGERVYIAGDTEAVPEMRELEDIKLAFVPMNLPYTMGIEQAAEGVLDFAPSVVYPYHHKGSDINAFEKLVNAGSADIQVVKAAWYS